ncbi:MAG TPA: GAF domain-containing protein [Roseiflexaceae bacterium]|nr:GAF domain-containing protein [Roseiflexaceae bacterium]
MIDPILSPPDLVRRHEELLRANAELEQRLSERTAALRQRSAELEVISRISQTLAQRPDLEVLVNLVGDALRDAFEAQTAYIALYDRTANLISFPYNLEEGRRIYHARLPFGMGLTSQIIRSRSPLLINDTSAYAREHGIGEFGSPSRSYLGVPILVSDEVIGVVSVQNTEREDAFGDSDMSLLATIAATIGGAIHKTRLMAERERRMREMRVLQDIASTITSTLNLHDVLERLHAGLGRVIDVSTSFIALYDAEQQLLTYPIARDSGQPVDFTPVSLAEHRGINYWVISNRRSLLIGTEEEAGRYQDGAPRSRVGPADQLEQSFLVVPILSVDDVVGVINIQSYEQHAFDSDDQRFVEMVAHQAAIAIRNAQLYDETRERAVQMAVLADVGRDISATLDLPTVLERIAGHARSLLKVDTSAVYLPEPDGRMFRAFTALGTDAGAILNHTFLLGEGIIGDLAQRGVPEIVTRPSADPRVRLIPGTTRQEHEQLMAAPLLAGQRVIGMMAVWRNRHRAMFTNTELEFLVGLARQAAIAIENARLFAEASKARNAAEAANVAKSTFLANMSHELRTPLNAVLGFAQVLERDPDLSARNREHLGIISRSGEHLLGLINDVLEMSKIEAGRVTFNPAPFDLRRLLQGVEEMFRLRAEARGLWLRVAIDPAVPRCVVSDENKLRQILINLLGNAVKFTHAGGIAMRVAPDPSGAPDQLLFEVADTGEGIPPEQLPNLFQAFVQTSSGVRAQEGTGLGLAISRQFARLMAGDIRVESRLGVGSTFQVDLPVQPADIDSPAYTPARRVLGLAPEHQSQPRILVVDDKWENRQLLIEWLRRAGFAVREAADGQEALEQWETWEPQLIWMDIRMPVLDGYEATRRIKSTLRGQATVVIALTASAFEHDQVGILSAGCDDFVSKPVRETLVFEKIAEHLGVRFVYEDEPEDAPLPAEGVPTSAALARLPEPLREALRLAVLVADIEQIHGTVADIREHDAPLADGLARLAEAFRIDQLLALVQSEPVAA